MIISSIIKNTYQLPEKFSILECGACSWSEVQTKEWIPSQEAWYLEPNKEIYKELKQLGCNILNLALSDHNELETFNVSSIAGWSHLGSSSLNDSIKCNQKLKNSYEVKCVTYKKLQQILNIEFDIVILDIEGNEDAVVKNLSTLEQSALPKIFCIECGYEWEKRKNLVKQLGYDLDFYYHNNAYFSIKNTYSKNIETVNTYNAQWPSWTFNGIKIYTNENTYL